ncbi:MAG: hypothetical protein HY007_01350 [Candidatus Sungbacteria bacterium]|nr:hypothetical protein [Candidatus Sungbacteria bacterium]
MNPETKTCQNCKAGFTIEPEDFAFVFKTLRISRTFDLSKRIMVIEGVFMFHPQLLNDLWDKQIYLTGDIDKIDARRIKREQEKWGSDYFPETHPDSYFRQVTIALQRYIQQYKPEKVADLVLRVH